MPACRIAPPWIFRRRCALWIVAFVEQTTLPTGAPRPFERQKVAVSNGSHQRFTDTPVFTCALKMRAPSRCVFIFRSRAVFAAAFCFSRFHTKPPPRLCVFSNATHVVGA